MNMIYNVRFFYFFRAIDLGFNQSNFLLFTQLYLGGHYSFLKHTTGKLKLDTYSLTFIPQFKPNNAIFDLTSNQFLTNSFMNKHKHRINGRQ